MIRILILITILLASCSDDLTQSTVAGCTTSTACNYNANATIDNGSCIEAQGCNNWCEGDETTLLELDCTGECGGQIVEDDCGECVDGVGADATPEDGSASLYTCAMACDGNYYNDDTAPSTDSCNICGGDNSTCLDCADVANGTAIYDNCGNCVQPSASCSPDCAGVWGGTQVDDNCGVCGGNDSTCTDCNDTVGGLAYMDACGECVGGTTELVSTCNTDCNNLSMGDAIADNCGTCDNDPTNDCTADCAGEWGGVAIEDSCGICNGDGSICTDCAGIENGTSTTDNCGTCDDDANNDCTTDCLSLIQISR